MRYADDLSIIEIKFTDHQVAVDVTVLPSDFAFSFNGILEPAVLPAGVYHSGHTSHMCPDLSSLGLDDGIASTTPIAVKSGEALTVGPDGIPYGFYKTTTGWILRNSKGDVIASDAFTRRPGEESFSFVLVTNQAATVTAGPDDGLFISATWYQHTPVEALGLTSGRYQKFDFLDDPSIESGATSRTFTVSPIGGEPAYVATICTICMVVVNSQTGIPGEELSFKVDLLDLDTNLVEFRGRLTRSE